MPQLVPVIIGAAATIGAEALGVAAFVGIESATAAAALYSAIGLAVSVATSLVLNALMPAAKKNGLNTSQASRTQSYRTAVAARPVVYGKTLVSGQIVYIGTTGADNRYLHVVVLLADHPIEAVDAVWINDVRIPAASWDGAGNVVAGSLAGLVRVRPYLGTQTTADADLVSETGEWLSTSVGYGCSYLYVRLLADRAVFPANLQNVAAEVRGKNTIYDPRSGTTGYTRNWALCVRDYLASEQGMACAADELDDDYFIAAANVADEAVYTTADHSASQPRYTCDGSFTLDAKRIDILTRLLTAGAGTLTYVQGRHRLHAGAYEAPSDSLRPADFAGTVKLITARSGAETYNGLRGTFVNPADRWQAAAFPAIFSTTWDAQDGERIWHSIDLPFTTDSIRAQRIATVMLQRSRYAMQLQAPVKYGGLRFAVKQVVAVTLPDLGFADKPFEVTGWIFEPTSGQVSLLLEETAAAAYSWGYDLAQPQPVTLRSTLANPLAIPACASLTVTATTQMQADGTAMPALLASWTPPSFPYLQSFEVQWRTTSGPGDWHSEFVDASQPRKVIAAVMIGTSYDVRVRACSALTRGAWSTTATGTGAADTTAPGAPTGLTALGILRGVQLRWTRDSAPDLDVTEIWESVDGGSTWYRFGESNSDTFNRNGLNPGDTANYKLRSRDLSGNTSGFTAATALVTVPTANTNDITPNAVSTTSTAAWTGSYSSSSYDSAVSLVVGEAGVSGELLVQYGIDGGSYALDGTIILYAQLLIDGVLLSSLLTGEGSKRAFARTTISDLHTLAVQIAGVDAAGFGYTPSVTAVSITATFIKR